MNVPANHVRRKTTGEVRPYELAASFFAPAKPQRALPAAKSAVRLLADPENQPESPGTRSKGAAIWGIPVEGGPCGRGTVFSITLSGTDKVLHSFC